MIILSRSFFRRSPLQVARDLLGKSFIHTIGNACLEGIITEVEAYGGSHDPASHAFRGKTVRNKMMFSEGGVLYVYFTYGMHFCANIVAGKEGIAGAVLIRAVTPVQGIELMMKNRGKTPSSHSDDHAPKDLTNGPAKFCQAFQITREHNGADLCSGDFSIVEKQALTRKILRSPRIGIKTALEKEWRLYFENRHR